MKAYSQTETNIILNFSASYAKKSGQILSSDGFNQLLKSYIASLEKVDDLTIEILKKETDDLAQDLTNIFKLLISFELDEILVMSDKYRKLLDRKAEILEVVEGLYNYWRHFERYAIINLSTNTNGIEATNFVEETNRFSDLILSTYRTIESKLAGAKLYVYRQLQAGINVGLVVSKSNFQYTGIYSSLNTINVIREIVLRPPFICYTKKNTRKGIFNEVDHNPLERIGLNPNHWYCYPARVGTLLIHVFFHRSFMDHGVSLANLFELASDEYLDKKPDAICIFGDKNDVYKEACYYTDKKNDILVGYTPYSPEFDYFGYMKKMILTLHNIKQIKNGFLPIHGAMVNVTLKDGQSKNIAILGDSGAGKSESLEAFRMIAAEYLKDMKIIFDDMGVFKLQNGELKAYGTEIGAFVRLDDLDVGYAYKQIDRAIFLNPNQTNSRLIVPCTNINIITKGFDVDMFLLANNFEDSDVELSIFTDVNEAKENFIKAPRMAKGTTSEMGLVTSFFANPFGPVQHESECREIIDEYFDYMMSHGITLGTLYTKLAIPGKETEGPREAARSLFKTFNK